MSAAQTTDLTVVDELSGPETLDDLVEPTNTIEEDFGNYIVIWGHAPDQTARHEVAELVAL